MDQMIGSLKAALASATNEVTVAAANINFDFSIVKYEAPKEFHPVGQLLSFRRKHEAEDGKCHTTARRLAALFAGICPKTPALIKAYGKRASEIATEATNKVSKEHFASVFSQYAGIDATSMWAAATSSQDADGGAIHVHLLACLLASVWEAPEATSIWVEIVAERRREIALQVERGEAVAFATATAAAQQDIPRQQLAEWDASARSWLETADSIKQRQQTQIHLILRNIESSIGSQTSVYLNVIEAWRTAAITMDNLVSGIAQEIYDGSAIIGLSAWHLYPDIHVFGQQNVEVKMDDDLILSGGILSLGCSPSPTTPKLGITWSLCLSKLKFYGDPVTATASMQGDSSKLTVREFGLALLGCLLRAWNIPPADNRIAVMTLRALSQSISDMNIHYNRWENHVCIGASILLREVTGNFMDDEKSSTLFINLGRNRPQCRPNPHKAGGREIGYQPFFGILNHRIFLQCLREPEDRINALRRCTSRVESLRDRRAIIRYKTAEEAYGYINLFADADTSTTSEPVGSPVKHARLLDRDLTNTIKYPVRFYGDWDGDSDSDDYDGRDDSDAGDMVNERILPTQFTSNGVQFQLYFGDSDLACIFLPVEDHDIFPLIPLGFLPEDLLWALQHDIFEFKLTEDGPFVSDAMFPWLCRFGYALSCLQTLSGPVIRAQILSHSHHNAKWATSWENRATHGYPKASGKNLWTSSSNAEKLSILAYFLGGCDVGLSELPESTTGVSFGNSIYVPTDLLHDPLLSRTGHHGITRILGNIGQPGLVIFSSVSNPITAPMDDNFWRVANLNTFDGRPQDLFSSTSMHLSFTQWERSIDMADSHGKQDVQFTKMESVISIRESGRWVGDVDVVSALRSPHIYILPDQEPCNHSVYTQPESQSLTSIESWDELRECQSGLAVVRVHGNWLARLAVTAYLAQRANQSGGNGARITLLPRSVCWHCLKHEFNSNVYIY